ncbi:MAG: transcriptional regulator [Rhodospirillaceae bacterium]|nr:transcriptional regulator [Rhodospirillaceae bacterium]
MIEDSALAHLVAEGESERVEFKERLSPDAMGRIEEAICAFANDLAGTEKLGVVIVGLNDNGQPVGIDVNDQLLLSLSDIRSSGNILPPPMLLVQKRQIQNQDIAVVTVAPSDTPPVQYKGRIHIRIGPRRGIATSQEERVLNERRRFADRPFDVRSISTANISDLNRRQFEEEYLPVAVAPDILQANDRSYSERLAAAKMIVSSDDKQPTVLGLLILGVGTRDFVAGSWVQFLRISGTDRGDEITDEAAIDGTLSEIVRQIEDKLRSHNRSSVDFTGADLEHRSEIYPLAALQQLVRNALMHRTYENTAAPVQVTWFNDRIEIQSPGGPYGLVTVDNFGTPGMVDYRNPNLAEAMKNMGYVQRFGAGIATTQKLLKDHGHPEASFLVSLTHVLASVMVSRNGNGEQK